MNKDLKIGQAVEIIRLKVAPENETKFLEGRKLVDDFVSKIDGSNFIKLCQIYYLTANLTGDGKREV